MSLGRLLTTGKSLVGLNDSTCRYRMRSQNLLPKFGAEKNPFTAKEEGVPSGEPATEAPEATTNFAAPSAEPAGERGGGETLTLSVAASPAAAAPEAPPAGGAAHWTGKLAAALRFPFSIFQRKAAAPAPARRVERKPAVKVPSAVQTELSLDNVKVLRNDLSDADVEIVPAGKAGAAGNRPALKPAEKRFAAELAGDAWDQVAARVLTKT